jgi:hypothetical protein
VVPERPGPLTHLKGASGRDRDELDELVNEFRRDVDKPVGWFDVTIFSGGLGLLGWGASLAWRHVRRTRHARGRSEILARGVPMRLSDPSMSRLVRAYDALCGSAGTPGVCAGGSAMVAGHSAVLDVATLLQRRVPDSVEERAYVDERAAAIEELTEALGNQQAEAPADSEISAIPGGIEPRALLQPGREVVAPGGFNSLARLAGLTAEARAHGSSDRGRPGQSPRARRRRRRRSRGRMDS